MCLSILFINISFQGQLLVVAGTTTLPLLSLQVTQIIKARVIENSGVE